MPLSSKMGVRKFRAYLKYMKRALLQKFMIEIDGEEEEELTAALRTTSSARRGRPHSGGARRCTTPSRSCRSE